MTERAAAAALITSTSHWPGAEVLGETQQVAVRVDDDELVVAAFDIADSIPLFFERDVQLRAGFDNPLIERFDVADPDLGHAAAPERVLESHVRVV